MGTNRTPMKNQKRFCLAHSTENKSNEQSCGGETGMPKTNGETHSRRCCDRHPFGLCSGQCTPPQRLECMPIQFGHSANTRGEKQIDGRGFWLRRVCENGKPPSVLDEWCSMPTEKLWVISIPPRKWHSTGTKFNAICPSDSASLLSVHSLYARVCAHNNWRAPLHLGCFN